MLKAQMFNTMMTKYGRHVFIKYLDFWGFFYESPSETEDYVIYQIKAQHKDNFEVVNHQFLMDYFRGIHRFKIVELNSDVVIKMLKRWHNLTEFDMEDIRLGLNHKSYYIIEYDFSIGRDHEDALWSEEFWMNYSVDMHNFKVFLDKQEAYDSLWKHIEKDWIVEEIKPFEKDELIECNDNIGGC